MIVSAIIVKPSIAQTNKPEWIYVTDTDEYDTIYVKSKYVTKDYQGIKVWTEWRTNTKEIDKKIYNYVVSKRLFIIDCNQQRMKMLNMYTYYDHNKFLDSQQAPYDEWDEAVPGSIGEVILNKVCELFNK